MLKIFFSDSFTLNLETSIFLGGFDSIYYLLICMIYGNAHMFYNCLLFFNLNVNFLILKNIY